MARPPDSVAEEPPPGTAGRITFDNYRKGIIVIDAGTLLADLQAELGRLAADLNQKVREDEVVRARLETEWRSAFDASRTGRTFEDWADDRLTQVAVAWLLACVFIRFCEDNRLIDEARIAGPGVRGAEAATPNSAISPSTHTPMTASTSKTSSAPLQLSEGWMGWSARVSHRSGSSIHPPMLQLGFSVSSALPVREEIWNVTSRIGSWTPVSSAISTKISRSTPGTPTPSFRRRTSLRSSSLIGRSRRPSRPSDCPRQL